MTRPALSLSRSTVRAFRAAVYLSGATWGGNRARVADVIGTIARLGSLL